MDEARIGIWLGLEWPVTARYQHPHVPEIDKCHVEERLTPGSGIWLVLRLSVSQGYMMLLDLQITRVSLTCGYGCCRLRLH